MIAGASVVATSPSLQASRQGATNPAGEYLIPFLPPGTYALAFRADGFAETRVQRPLSAGATARVDVSLQPEGAAESVTVIAAPESVIGESATLASTYPSRLLDQLPVDRSFRGANLLTPGVAASGLGGSVMIAGAMSYENLYLVDGVSVREIIFGRPRPFPVEDAVDETITEVSGISAEYGRFSGGVVNVLTRSGGNRMSGSLRATLVNDAWRSLVPYERGLSEDPRENELVPTWEATFGGPVVRDRLWYFLAGRRSEVHRDETLTFTDLPYRFRTREERFEAKGTWTPGPGQTLQAAYSAIDTVDDNILAAPAADYASLSPRSAPEDLLSVHYTSSATGSLFVEAQYSRRRRTIKGIGAYRTDLIGGTVIRDGSRANIGFNSPALCAVCGAGSDGLRHADEGDRGYAAKATGFVDGRLWGTHQVVGGGEVADQLRRSDAYQSGSGYVITASGSVLRGGEVFPVFRPGGSTVIEWRPLVGPSKGSRFRTISGFVNDQFRLGSRWSLNLGLRWDADDSRDQSGTKVGDSATWSPRLAVALDPRGDGVWTLDAGFARYVSALDFQLGDLGSSRGRTARYSYTYNGPPINAAGTLVATERALAELFDWFRANGGTEMPLRQAPAIPGLNRRVGNLVPPRTEEWTLGITRQLGDRGSLRLVAVHRDTADQYSERVDLSTGQVSDPGSGRRYDLRLIENGAAVRRTYRALLAQADLKVSRSLRVSAGYTLAANRGNFDGDDAVPDLGGATPESDLYFYPEYGAASWRAPNGPLRSDRRHSLRAWATWAPTRPEPWGRISLSLLERIDSGQKWNVVGLVDSRPYVENPGYVGPPARVPYFFEPRGSLSTDPIVATDLAAVYSISPRILRPVELFLRVVAVNVFDQHAQIRPGNSSVVTAANAVGYAPFDPFTDQPVRGRHWDVTPGFGEALSADDYAPPRSFNLSIGLRF